MRQMDFQGLKLFSALQGKMSWLERRQKMLSENVANANTSDYTPKDLKDLHFSDVLVRTSTSAAKVARTHPNHQSPPSEVRGGEVYHVKSLETQRNGNGVGLEEEMTKLADTRMTHELVTNLYRKHAGMLRVALGRGN
ncbi:hypothetical protein [Govanella unica]|uniref:Flagellar basal body rod protein FlgB n=1 Tax=Govanella unica TaxID=2975056 RepID=A0A9X3Z6K7_9PROT|nr:hypothetical protein [Govania unica]MDA5193231.1 hypothetical protein [Govania unica]